MLYALYRVWCGSSGSQLLILGYSPILGTWLNVQSLKKLVSSKLQTQNQTHNEYAWPLGMKHQPLCGCWVSSTSPYTRIEALYWLIAVEWLFKSCYICSCCGTIVLMVQRCVTFSYIAFVWLSDAVILCLSKTPRCLIKSWRVSSEARERIGGPDRQRG